MTLEHPIPQSASQGEEPQGGKGSSWLEILKFIWQVISDIRSWLVAAGTVGSAYAVYTASYLVVRKYQPDFAKRLPDPLIFIIKKVPVKNEGGTPNPVGQNVARRVTVVDRGPEAKPALLVLKAMKGPLTGERITVDKDYFSIGAGPDNDLSISADSYLSDKHAAIRTSGDGWVLIDQQSTNGTFVDGKELTSESEQKLQPGQVIRLGDSEFQVVNESLDKAGSGAGRKWA